MESKMKAAVFEGPGILNIKEVDVPILQEDNEVIIEVEVCSICGTDVHILSTPPGYVAKPGTILGHELVGRISEIGNKVDNLKVGDRVVVNPNDYCGTCDYCLMNMPNHCINVKPMGIDYDGGFAKYVKTSAKMAHKISEKVPAQIAAFAEPLACAINATQKVRVQPGETVLILGAGPIGLLIGQLMKASGATVICSEISDKRRNFAGQNSADYIVNPMTDDLEGFVKTIAPLGADVVVDVVGSQLEAAIKAVRRGGKVLLFGVNSIAKPSVIQSQITFKEISILGTWLANATFPMAVKVLESNKLNLEPMVTHTMPLDSIREGVELLRSGEGIEIIITL